MSPEDIRAPGSGGLAPTSVRALLQTDFWVGIEGGGPTGSTNDDARVLAERGAPEGTAVLASSQTAGRGRFRRSWRSPEGGVHLSAVLRPRTPDPGLSALPLAVGLGVALGLERLGATPRLKWPNDVLLDEGKVAGVLVESRIGDTDSDAVLGLGWVVVGVGVNVLRSSAPGDLPRAAFVADALPGVTLAAVAAAVLDGMAEAYGRYVSGGFAALRDDYRSRLETLGRDVEVADITGTLLARGTALDIDAQGRLLVQTPAGTVAVASGEVTLGEAGSRA